VAAAATVPAVMVVLWRRPTRLSSLYYPMLSDTNYGVWAVKMKIILHHLGAWVLSEIW
jgi:hypothetical protein